MPKREFAILGNLCLRSLWLSAAIVISAASACSSATADSRKPDSILYFHEAADGPQKFRLALYVGDSGPGSFALLDIAAKATVSKDELKRIVSALQPYRSDAVFSQEPAGSLSVMYYFEPAWATPGAVTFSVRSDQRKEALSTMLLKLGSDNKMAHAELQHLADLPSE